MPSPVYTRNFTMKHFFFKSFFQNCIASIITLLLMVAATIALAIGISLYQSAHFATDTAREHFLVLPVVNINFGRKTDTVYDKVDKDTEEITIGADWFIGELPVREMLYKQSWESMAASRFVAHDDRRIYLGYSEGLLALRSEDLLESSIDHSYQSFYTGNGSYEKTYFEIVADVTLLDKEMIDPGGPIVFEDGSRSAIIGPSGEELDGFLPRYFYTFQINRILAKNSFAPIQVQKLYATINQEMFCATDLELGMRCLLYSTYDLVSDLRFGSEGKSPDALQGEEGEFYHLRLDQGMVRDPEDGRNFYTGLPRFIVLSGSTPLDFGSVASFAQSAELPQAEAERWYEIIQNCSETMESLYIATTEDLRRVTPFNTDAMYILDGRSITPDDAEAICVISAELALRQNIRVGDNLPIRLRNAEFMFTEGALFVPWDNSQPWSLQSPADRYGAFAEIEYEVVGIYQSMGWDDRGSTQHINPGTIFVSAAATPRSGNEITTWYTPQVMWGFYLKNSDDAEAFLASLPEELRDSVQIVDQGYSHVKPLLWELRNNARTVLLVTFTVWLAVACIFLFLHVFRNKHTMGILRSLGMPARKVFSVFLLACMGLWLAATLIGGTVSALLYGELESQVQQSVFESDTYNQAFSDLGLGADQGNNPWTGETDNTAAELSQRIFSEGNAVSLVLLSLGIQGVLFFGFCAGTIWLVSRQKVSRLLKGT